VGVEAAEVGGRDGEGVEEATIDVDVFDTSICEGKLFELLREVITGTGAVVVLPPLLARFPRGTLTLLPLLLLLLFPLLTRLPRGMLVVLLQLLLLQLTLLLLPLLPLLPLLLLHMLPATVEALLLNILPFPAELFRKGSAGVAILLLLPPLELPLLLPPLLLLPLLLL